MSAEDHRIPRKTPTKTAVRRNIPNFGEWDQYKPNNVLLPQA